MAHGYDKLDKEVWKLSSECTASRGGRICEHPILGSEGQREWTTIAVDGTPIRAMVGEPVAAAIMASGRRVLRHTPKYDSPRGVYCAIGLCTDCVMTVNGHPNIRTCVTAVEPGMTVETQKGLGK